LDKKLLYHEIAEAIRQDLMKGHLKPGDRLPSVRAMTTHWNCTPGTVQRAYQILVSQGLAVSRSGQGTHIVASVALQADEPLRRAALVHKAEEFLLETLSAGHSPSEVEQAVRMALDRWRALSESAVSPETGVLRFVGSHDPAVALIASALGTPPDWLVERAHANGIPVAALAGRIDHAVAHQEAGVDLIGVGDAAASLVGPKIYEEFVWPYEKRLVDGLHAMGTRVRLHICGNINRILASIGRLGCEIVDLDFMVPVAKARHAMGPNQVLLGNLDPVKLVRHGTPESVAAAVAQCHHEAGPRYIVGAGCEIPRDTPTENVHALGAYARSAQRRA
jgi:DNA-binding transcriptional regulator YhcF (GntR family)